VSALHVVVYMDVASFTKWKNEADDRWEDDDVSYDDRFNELEYAVARFLGQV